MAEHSIAPVGDIGPGQRLIVHLEGRSIGVFNLEGEFCAVRNQCPHQGGPVCEGIVVKAWKAAVEADGQVREYLDDRQQVLCCPNHGIEFDVRTGACLANPRWRLRVYDTRIEEGKVVVVV